MKFGRNIVNIGETDLILDNGACYQIVTSAVGGFGKEVHPIVSKVLFRQLKTCGMVYTNETLKELARKHYRAADDSCTYWKFNMEVINKYEVYKEDA
jgi:hypothetical protein